MALSRDRSATIRFSLAFSSSSWRSRLISEGISPAYFFFQLKYVAWLIPTFRQTSATAEPSSACFKTNAICASENFDAFMELSSSHQGDHKWKIPVQTGLVWRGQVNR